MRDVVSSFVTTALIQVANIGSGIMLARILLPDGRGELAAVMLWPMVIAALGIFGIHEAAAYLVSRRAESASKVLRAGLLTSVALSLLLLLVGAAVVDVVFARRDPDVRLAAFLFLAFIPLNTVTLVIAAVFQARQSFGVLNVLRAMVHILYLLLIPVFVLVGMANVLGFTAAFLIAVGVTMAAAAAAAWRLGWFGQGGVGESVIASVRELLRYGGRMHFGAVVSIVAERLDQLLISITFNAADLGHYVVALTVARLPLVLALTFGSVAFPKIAVAALDTRNAILSKYSRATVGSTVMIVICLAAMVPLILRLFFGAAFADAAPIVFVLLIGVIPLSLKSMLSAGLKACDHGPIVGQAELVALVLSVAALAALLPVAGLLGAAAASAIAQTGALLFMLARTQRTLGISPRQLLQPTRADFTVIADIWRAMRGAAGRGGTAP